MVPIVDGAPGAPTAGPPPPCACCKGYTGGVGLIRSGPGDGLLMCEKCATSLNMCANNHTDTCATKLAMIGGSDAQLHAINRVLYFAGLGHYLHPRCMRCSRCGNTNCIEWHTPGEDVSKHCYRITPGTTCNFVDGLLCNLCTTPCVCGCDEPYDARRSRVYEYPDGTWVHLAHRECYLCDKTCMHNHESDTPHPFPPITCKKCGMCIHAEGAGTTWSNMAFHTDDRTAVCFDTGDNQVWYHTACLVCPKCPETGLPVVPDAGQDYETSNANEFGWYTRNEITIHKRCMRCSECGKPGAAKNKLVWYVSPGKERRDGDWRHASCLPKHPLKKRRLQ